MAVADAVLRLGGIAKISESKPREQFGAQLKELDACKNDYVEAGDIPRLLFKIVIMLS